MTRRMRSHFRSEQGKTILEFGLILPLVVALVTGIVELSYGLLDRHQVRRLSLWTVLRLSW
jgi:Flp pilus assembly protein TadG